MTTRLSLTLTALALLQPSLARAEMVDFSYSISVSPSTIDVGGGHQITSDFTPSGTASALTGATIATYLPAVSWISSAPALFYSEVKVDTDVTAEITVTDKLSGQSGHFRSMSHFHGEHGQPTATYFSPSPQDLQLGGYIYHFCASGIGSPSDLNSPFAAGFFPTVAVSSASNSQAPEPSCLALGALAAGGFALSWRRGRTAVR